MAAEPRNVDVKAAALVTLLAFLWAGNPIAIKIGLDDAPPIRQAWMRFVLGGLTVLVWAWVIRTPLRIHRREVRPLLVLGVIFTVQIALLNLGVKYTSAGHVAILLNAYPIYTVLLAQVAFSVPCYLLVSLLFEAAHPYRWTWSLGLALGFQGFIVAGFNFILNLQLLKTYKPSGLAAYFLTTPIFGVFLSWLILDEAITLRLLTSAVLVVGGVALASRPSGVPGRRAVVPRSAEEA